MVCCMTDQPKYQRRKEDRPQEIADAAFETFAEKGYAATRIDDVAKRAGGSRIGLGIPEGAVCSEA